MKKAKQIHKKEQQNFSTEQIVEFLESYRELVAERDQVGSKLISIKMPIHLLKAFRFKADKEGMPYQTKIKQLMKEWVLEAAD